MSNTYNVTLIYKENIIITVENATEYILLQDEYKNDSSFPLMSKFSMPIGDTYLRKILITDNYNSKTLDVVNVIIFKIPNGEQAVTTKDLLSISITRN
ncbi:hypothetical protein [uncultured Tyzzerella sp.]|uniref:hypothetical protein n=1 Tax=uncultured Tyzzerella sp. TaxID=2321398 RepID=UPI0029427DAD|nr:hypothetical protein [uncultured Tyzzerella sp.]